MSKCNHVAPYMFCVMCAGTIIPHEERHAPHVHFEYSTERTVERFTPAAVTTGNLSGTASISFGAYGNLTNATP